MCQVVDQAKFALTLILIFGCTKNEGESAYDFGQNTFGLRSLTTDEAVADFRQLVGSINAFYGPYQYKEQKFNYKIETLAQEYEEEMVRFY